MTSNQVGFTRPVLLVFAMAVATPAWAVSVSLTSPTNSVVSGPATIAVTATATPGTGRRILRVDFFKGATRIGTDTNAPYGVVLSNVSFGTYVFTALAIDSGGSVAISDPVIVRVDSPPSVALTTPGDNSTFAPGADIPVAASASDSDEVVRKVEFFAGNTLIGTQVLAPYQITWGGVPSGRYRLTARATDLVGLVTTSAPVTITVGSAPTVNMMTPTPGAVVKGGTITVTAQASDSDGTIAKVEFFDGGDLVGTTIASPGSSSYSATLSNLAVGSHTLTARATDDQGLSSTSSPVPITVSTAVAQMYFIYTDHLNTPRMLTSQAGATVWKWDQAEPFGNGVPNADPDGDGITFDFPMRLPGQYADRETNLTYNNFRDYDPSIGRYSQSDLTGLLGGLNTYLYVSAQPLRSIDPRGLADCELRSRYFDPFDWDWNAPKSQTDLGYIPLYLDSGATAKCLFEHGRIPNRGSVILGCIGRGLKSGGLHLYRIQWEVHHEVRREVRIEEWCKEGCPAEWKFKGLVYIGYQLLSDTIETKTRYDVGRPPRDEPSPF